MNDFDYQGIPYFKIEQGCSQVDFSKQWIQFCNKNGYALETHVPKMGWLNEDFENFKITVVANFKPLLHLHPVV